jgi:hypothetical protein
MTKQDLSEYDLLFPNTAEALTAWSLLYSQYPETWLEDIRRWQSSMPFITSSDQTSSIRTSADRTITEWLVWLPLHVADTVYQIEQSERAGFSFVTVANVRFELMTHYSNQVRQRIA